MLLNLDIAIPISGDHNVALISQGVQPNWLAISIYPHCHCVTVGIDPRPVIAYRDKYTHWSD